MELVQDTIQEKNNILSFAALNPVYESNIIKPTERDTRNKQKVEWGTSDKYPIYINNLFENAPTLRSLVLGTVDYAAGNNVVCNVPKFAIQFNADGDTIEDVYRQFVQDYILYGCAALHIIRNLGGEISQIYNINMKFLRADKKNTTFYYSEDFDGNKYTNRVKTLVYPKYDPESNEPSSIFYVKNDKYRTYGLPLWCAAVECAEIERNIKEFNLNEIENGFTGSYMICLNNGVPTDAQKEEIEEGFSEKYGGYQNAGRMVIAYSQDKDHSAEILAIPTSDFADKYANLKASVEQGLFTAFRAHPSLFGIPTNGSNLNKEDYSQVFALFNKTMVLPLQKMAKRAFEKLFNVKDAITVEPFTVDFEEDQTENNEEIK